jgi:hypothetical protein
MKESYSEGLANHTGLRSYAGGRKAAGGTLIEVRAGRVWRLSIKLCLKDESCGSLESRLEHGIELRESCKNGTAAHSPTAVFEG